MGKTALVISGGGCKGAFALGVLDYLNSSIPDLQFDILCGTSTGALITPLAAIGKYNALIDIYKNSRTSSVILRGSVADRFMSASSLFDVSPLVNLLKATVTQADYDKLIATGKDLFLTTVCLQTGHIVYFSTSSLPSSTDYDVIKIGSLEDLQRGMLASADMPVFTPPIEFKPGSTPIRQYVDGGVREYAPIQVAMDDGATEIFAILHSAEDLDQTADKCNRTFDVLVRTMGLFCDDVGINDVRVPMIYNRGLHYVAEVKQKLIHQKHLSVQEVEDIFAVPDDPFAGKKEVTIHIFRPAKAFAVDPLELDPVAQAQMFDAGRSVAETVVAHGPLAGLL